MSEQVKGFVVALRQDISEEHANKIKTALEMIGGVVAVSPSVADADDWMNREQIRHELGAKLWDVLHPKAAR